MTLLFLIFAILSLLMAIVVLGFVVIGFLGEWLGAPFVPTSGKDLDQILADAKLKKGLYFVELGSGDGRMLRRAVKLYGVKGLGVEIHPILVAWSRILAKLQGLKGIEYRLGNFNKVNLSKTDVLFIFLLPKTLKKLENKFENELLKGTLVISHGFEIPDWQKRLIFTRSRKMFSTYYYKV